MARWFPVDLALKPCGPMFEAPDRPTARQIARDRGLFGWNVRSALDVHEDQIADEIEAKRKARGG
ncbi:MAG TPA: hypothetical protein PK308_00200 [Phycisphaerales bacterium]|nr:hypothetical protein [Phycisphaerales bacterium]